MNGLLEPIIFGFAMLALGIVILVFEKKICSSALRRQGKVLFPISPTEIKWSIRGGGIMAILIGSFVLWMCWRNY